MKPKTRLMVLMTGYDQVCTWDEGWAILNPYENAKGVVDRFQGAFRVPVDDVFYHYWGAKSESAALRKARRWLREVGAEEVTC